MQLLTGGSIQQLLNLYPCIESPSRLALKFFLDLNEINLAPWHNNSSQQVFQISSILHVIFITIISIKIPLEKVAINTGHCHLRSPIPLVILGLQSRGPWAPAYQNFIFKRKLVMYNLSNKVVEWHAKKWFCRHQQPDEHCGPKPANINVRIIFMRKCITQQCTLKLQKGQHITFMRCDEVFFNYGSAM